MMSDNYHDILKIKSTLVDMSNIMSEAMVLSKEIVVCMEKLSEIAVTLKEIKDLTLETNYLLQDIKK